MNKPHMLEEASKSQSKKEDIEPVTLPSEDINSSRKAITEIVLNNNTQLLAIGALFFLIILFGIFTALATTLLKTCIFGLITFALIVCIPMIVSHMFPNKVKKMLGTM